MHLRQRMAEWLVLTKGLNGKSYPEVIALLGEPPINDKFHGPGLVYALGKRRFSSLDAEWLVLILGKAGTVENATVITD